MFYSHYIPAMHIKPYTIASENSLDYNPLYGLLYLVSGYSFVKNTEWMIE